ncbi:hypothetical protein C8J56DRAFT_897214 [Mycena floridula]|nr:hypothetical protein C8J56DRAFT_897214 [Mycena floridula]
MSKEKTLKVKEVKEKENKDKWWTIGRGRKDSKDKKEKLKVDFFFSFCSPGPIQAIYLLVLALQFTGFRDIARSSSQPTMPAVLTMLFSTSQSAWHFHQNPNQGSQDQNQGKKKKTKEGKETKSTKEGKKAKDQDKERDTQPEPSKAPPRPLKQASSHPMRVPTGSMASSIVVAPESVMQDNNRLSFESVITIGERMRSGSGVSSLRPASTVSRYSAGSSIGSSILRDSVGSSIQRDGEVDDTSSDFRLVLQ